MERELLIKKETNRKPNELNIKKIDRILSHYQPHPDEYLAEVLARRFGQNHFRFVRNMRYEYISGTVGDLAKDNPNTLFLGAGGGPFDDHGARHEKSCSELMAHYLGIEEDPAVIKLLEIVTCLDKERSKATNMFTVGRVTKQMHRYVGNEGTDSWTADDIRRWTSQLFNVIIDDEMKLQSQRLTQIKRQYQDVKDENERKKQVREAYLNLRRPWCHLTIPACSKMLGNDGPAWYEFAQEAASRQQQAFDKARSIASDFIEEFETPEYGTVRGLFVDSTLCGESHGDCEIEFDAISRYLKVDVVLLRNSHGMTFVGLNTNSGGNLEEFVKRLRRKEAEMRGIELPHFQLTAQGTLEALPQWHVHEFENVEARYTRVYNGTMTRPFIEPTLLSFEEIKHLLMGMLMRRTPSIGGTTYKKPLEPTPEVLAAFLHPRPLEQVLRS